MVTIEIPHPGDVDSIGELWEIANRESERVIVRQGYRDVREPQAIISDVYEWEADITEFEDGE